jgi:hypothetical protein
MSRSVDRLVWQKLMARASDAEHRLVKAGRGHDGGVVCLSFRRLAAPPVLEEARKAISWATH